MESTDLETRNISDTEDVRSANWEYSVKKEMSMKKRARNVRLQRKMKRSCDEECIIESVKDVKERKFKQLGEGRLKFKKPIIDKDREKVFKEHWEKGECNRLVACLGTLVTTSEMFSEKEEFLWSWFKHEKLFSKHD
jgi:hypothetical protein